MVTPLFSFRFGFNPLPCASKGETPHWLNWPRDRKQFQSAPLREQGRNPNPFGRRVLAPPGFNPLPCASKGETRDNPALDAEQYEVSIRSPARAREKRAESLEAPTSHRVSIRSPARAREKLPPQDV